METNQVINKALEWAYESLGTQGALDMAEALNIRDYRECSQCYPESEMKTPHFEDCCVVCGSHNDKYESGHASIFVELKDGKLTVRHGEETNCILLERDAPVGIWDHMWTALREHEDLFSPTN